MNRARNSGSYPHTPTTLLAATSIQARRVWPADTAGRSNELPDSCRFVAAGPSSPGTTPPCAAALSGSHRSRLVRSVGAAPVPAPLARSDPDALPRHHYSRSGSHGRTHQSAILTEKQRQLPPHQIDPSHHPRVIRIKPLIHQRLAVLSIHAPLDAQPTCTVPAQIDNPANPLAGTPAIRTVPAKANSRHIA
jgi:hypothetical protein